MIDKQMESYYDIMLSIFAGVILIIMLDQFFEKPYMIVKESDHSSSESSDTSI